MKRWNAGFFVALAVQLAGACSDSVDPGTGAGTTTSGTTVDELAAKLCPPACRTAQTCAATWSAMFDPPSCEAQCARELAGSGYFNAEFAPLYFETMSKLDEDPSCNTTRFLTAWGAPYEPHVLHPEVLQKCVDDLSSCGLAGVMSICFLGYYIYNEPQRTAFEPCLTSSCVTLDSCACNTTLPGAPWVAIPFVEVDAVPTCPP